MTDREAGMRRLARELGVARSVVADAEWVDRFGASVFVTLCHGLDDLRDRLARLVLLTADDAPALSPETRGLLEGVLRSVCEAEAIVAGAREAFARLQADDG